MDEVIKLTEMLMGKQPEVVRFTSSQSPGRTKLQYGRFVLSSFRFSDILSVYAVPLNETESVWVLPDHWKLV